MNSLKSDLSSLKEEVSSGIKLLIADVSTATPINGKTFYSINGKLTSMYTFTVTLPGDVQPIYAYVKSSSGYQEAVIASLAVAPQLNWYSVDIGIPSGLHTTLTTAYILYVD